MPGIEIQYYLKELLSNNVPSLGGVPWENIGGDLGVISTNDAGIIYKLASVAATRTGGVVKITEARYSELKKNSTSTASAPNSREPRVSVQPNLIPPSRPPAAVAEAAPPAAPPRSEPKPEAAPAAPARRGRPKPVP